MMMNNIIESITILILTDSNNQMVELSELTGRNEIMMLIYYLIFQDRKEQFYHFV